MHAFKDHDALPPREFVCEEAVHEAHEILQVLYANFGTKTLSLSKFKVPRKSKHFEADREYVLSMCTCWVFFPRRHLAGSRLSLRYSLRERRSATSRWTARHSERERRI